MLTIAILAIITTFAAPSIQGMIANGRLQGVSSDLAADLSLTRGTAAAKGQRVTMCQSSDGATCTGGSLWQAGWIVFVDANSNGTFDAGDTMIKVHQAVNTAVTVAPFSTTGSPPVYSAANTAITSVRYRPSGPTTNAAAIGFRVCQTGYPYRDVVVSGLGRLSSSVSTTLATTQTTTDCS